MPSLSASSYITFRTCPRLYYWQYVLYLERVREEGARRFGTLYHAGMEAWWRIAGDKAPWVDQDEPLVQAMKGIAENARHIQTDRFEVAKAEAMMIGYHARYFELEFEPVHEASDGVEVYFRLPLRDENGRVIEDWWMTGRKDAQKRFPDGRIKVVEHKSTASEIHGGSDYWLRLQVDTQCSIYIDAAQTEGLDVDEVMYDVSRKPGTKPLLTTPEEKRKFTKGKGCTGCGGRAGGKLGVAQGTGTIMVLASRAGVTAAEESKCPTCEGSGWKLDEKGKPDAPRLHADQRIIDESVADYRMRVGEEIRDDPNAYYRQGIVRRNADQLAETRADLVVTAGEISALIARARSATTAGELNTAEARRSFPRNTQACTNIYGRRCDYIDVCAGVVDPWQSQLYQLKPKRTERDADNATRSW